MFDQPPDLSPDLDWILHSNQVSDKLLIETLVRDYYNELNRFALIVLEDDALALQVATNVIVEAVTQRDTYWGNISGRCWLYKHAWRNCRKNLPDGFLSKVKQTFFPRPRIYTIKNRKLPENRLEAANWKVIDGLDYRSRVAFVLTTLVHFDISDVAEVLEETEPKIQKRLQLAINKFHKTIDPLNQKEWTLEDIIITPLERRWPLEIVTDSQFEEVINRVRGHLDGKGQQTQMRSSFQRLSVSMIAIVLVGLILWFTNMSADRNTRNPLISEKIIVTHIVKVTVYITTTPNRVETPEPVQINPGY